MDSALPAVLTCLVSKEARECESNCLHTLADLIGPVRKCPHCGHYLYEPESDPPTPTEKREKEGKK